MNKYISISIYEDNKHLRESLVSLFQEEKDFLLLGAFEKCTEIEKHVSEVLPEILLMDIDMPEMSGIEGLQLALKVSPSTIVVMYTVFEEDDKVFKAICAGAKGYILKDTPNEKLVELLKDIFNGGAYMSPVIAAKVMQSFSHRNEKDFKLTDKEKNVLQLLVEGYSYKMIANETGISLDTVRFHLKNIYHKLQVNSNVEAVNKAIKYKIF